MSAIALTLAEMGHAVSGSDLRELPVLDRLRAAGVTVHVGHDSDHVKGVDAVTGSTAIPASNVELVAAAEDGVTVLRRAGMLAAICAQADALAVAGTHGKTTTTSMLAMVLAEAGLDPSYIVGGDLHEMGTGAHWSGGRVARGRGRRERRHPPRAAAGRHHPHQRRGRPPRPLRHLRRGRRRASTATWPRSTAPRSSAPTTRWPRTWRSGTARSRTASTPTRRYRARDMQQRRGSAALRRRPRREPSWARSSSRCAGMHNVRNALGAIAIADAIGVPFDGHRASPGPLRRGGPPVRLCGHATTASPWSTTTRTSPARSRRCSPPRPAAVTAGPAASPSSSPTATTAWPCCRRSTPTRSSTPTWPSSPTSTRPARRRSPASPGSWSSNAVLDAHPEQRVVWLPQRAELVAYLVGELRPGDVCISMGCGDVAALPDEVLAGLAPEGDGHEPAGGGGGTSGRHPRTAGRAGRTARAVDDVPGRRARRDHGPGGVGRPPGRRAPRRWPGPGCPCSWSAGARTCSWPTAASLVWPSCWGRSRRRSRSRVGRGRRGSREPARPGPQDRRRGAHRPRVGRRRARFGGRRRAHERRRPWLGHRLHACRGPRVRPAQRRGL